jgi:hypothetical protein
MTYRKYLESDYWQQVKTRVVERSIATAPEPERLVAGIGRCEKCNYIPFKPGVLQVHHLTYKHRGNELNFLHDLILVCPNCHKKLHGITDKTKGSEEMKEREQFSYEVQKEYGVLSEDGAYSLRMRSVSWKGGEPHYDLRRWKQTDSGEIAHKGLVLSREEVEELRKILDGMGA